jgi:hypothetical protein
MGEGTNKNILIVPNPIKRIILLFHETLLQYEIEAYANMHIMEIKEKKLKITTS